VRRSFDLTAQGAAKEGRDPKSLRRAGYIFFGSSNDAREAVDTVRNKLAFVMRKFKV
jgi:hypothetical protein